MNQIKQQNRSTKLLKSMLAIGAIACIGNAMAADGFRTHFASSGTLGENIFSSDIRPGSFAGIGYKQATADSLTDGAGNNINQVALRPGLSIPLVYHNEANVKYLFAGVTSQEQFAGGHITAAIVLPFTSFNKTVTLGPGGPLPAAVSLPNSSAKVSKLDDVEFGATWDYKKSDVTKYSVGLALTTTTGSYQVVGNGASVGQGYTTLKPSFASITQDGAFSYAYKATLGLNGNNNDANYNSGNVLSLEAALGYKTSVGAFGFKVHSLKQYQDDTGTGVSPNNPYPWVATSGVSAPKADGNRISYTAATVYYTVPVKPLESLFYIGFSTMKNPAYTTVPKAGYFEMRLTKAFN
jgi:hypothetical protein